MTNARPLLGIICCNRDIGGRMGQVVANRYVEPVLSHLGAAGLIIPAISDIGSIRQIAGMFDGLLLTGSPTNVLPSRYSAPVESGIGPFDDSRDRVVFALIEALIARGKPIFGICRGFQEINVFFGGSLRCDVGSARDHPHHLQADDDTRFDDLFDHRHPVAIQPGGLLDDLFPQRLIEVNSVHHQGVATLGSGLRVEAVADDGLVEAISVQCGQSTILGVQWHPEWDLATNPQSQAVFNRFGQLLHAKPQSGRGATGIHGRDSRGLQQIPQVNSMVA